MGLGFVMTLGINSEGVGGMNFFFIFSIVLGGGACKSQKVIKGERAFRNGENQSFKLPGIGNGHRS